MSRNNAHIPVFELAFENCYISDDQPRNINKPVVSREIPFLSFEDDLYRQPGPSRELRITSKFKATKAICNYDKDGPTSLEFWKMFKALPTKVRSNIYKLLIFAWSPDAQWARLSRNGRRFSISRRTSRSNPLRPAHYLSDDTLGVTKEDLREWTEEKNWEQSEGMLDFFKLNEYRNIQKLVWFIEKIESTLQLDKSKREEAIAKKAKGKETQKRNASNDENINLWEEVVAFFWDNVVIDFGERLHYGTIVLMESARQKNLQRDRCTTEDNHAEVKHICLHLDNIWHSGDHTTTVLISDHCELCRFLLLCEFIAEHFQKVETLLLYLSLTTDAMNFLTINDGDVAQDVVTAIRALKVSKTFDVRVRIVNQDDMKDGVLMDDDVLDDWSREAQLWFLAHLSPTTILANKNIDSNKAIGGNRKVVRKHGST